MTAAEQPFALTYPDGRIMICNQAFCELTGYSEEELRGMRWDIDLTPPEWRELEAKRIKELYLTGEARPYVKEYIRKDGSRVRVEVFRQLVRDSEGNVRYYNVFVNEVGNGKERPRRSWEKSIAHFTLMGRFPGIAYRCLNDRNWTMKWIVGRCYELTGYHPSDLIDNRRVSWNDLIHPDDRERVWDVAVVDFEEGRPFQQEYRIITADGTVKWVWEQCRGFRTSKGEEYFEGFITDVTARKQAEEEIRECVREQDAILSEVASLNSQALAGLANLRALLKGCQGGEDALHELRRCMDALLAVQSHLYRSKRLADIDFAGYTQLAQDIEFIFNGKDYLYLGPR